MGPYPHDAPPPAISDENPMGTDGFEFVEYCHPEPEKLDALSQVLARRGLDWNEVAYVGDDLADLLVMRRVGLPIAVANAVPEIRAVAAVTTTAPGGHGAVREIVDALLKARGVWTDMLERYFTEPARRDG